MKEEIITSEHYIASLDLLGGKKLINSSESLPHLNNIHEIYESIKRISLHAGGGQEIKLKFFSDNIIVAVENTGANPVETLLEFVGYMAEHFLRNGYKLRGGITKGELYIDDTFVWGKGLVQAYLLESELAIYPRILVDNVILSDIRSTTKELMICQDMDGFNFLNYLNGYGGSSAIFLDEINKAIPSVENELEDIQDSDKKGICQIKLVKKLSIF